MTVHGIDAIRSRAAAGQPMKAWTYYRHHNLWDAYEPFVQEAHDDRLELLALLDRLPDYEAAADALERLTNLQDTKDYSAAWDAGRAALARLREPVLA